MQLYLTQLLIILLNLLLLILSYLAYGMLLSGFRRGGVFVIPCNPEYITSLIALITTLRVLLALRRYIGK